MSETATTLDPSLSLRADLSDQVAIVTGASQGLGRAIALGSGGQQGQGGLCRRGTRKSWPPRWVPSKKPAVRHAVAGDVASRESVEAVVDQVVDTWDRLDILVNNAGITRDTLLPRMSDQEWDDVINTNLRGAFLMCRAASRVMMRARYGRIINISSVSGLIGQRWTDKLLSLKSGVDRDDTQLVARDCVAAK